jgi:hypothetical protein
MLPKLSAIQMLPNKQVLLNIVFDEKKIALVKSLCVNLKKCSLNRPFKVQQCFRNWRTFVWTQTCNRQAGRVDAVFLKRRKERNIN